MFKRQDVLLERILRKANKGFTILHPTEHVRIIRDRNLALSMLYLRDFLKVVLNNYLIC